MELEDIILSTTRAAGIATLATSAVITTPLSAIYSYSRLELGSITSGAIGAAVGLTHVVLAHYLFRKASTEYFDEEETGGFEVPESILRDIRSKK